MFPVPLSKRYFLIKLREPRLQFDSVNGRILTSNGRLAEPLLGDEEVGTVREKEGDYSAYSVSNKINQG
jgi:hypothetical protein